jgi:hypothetical protein
MAQNFQNVRFIRAFASEQCDPSTLSSLYKNKYKEINIPLTVKLLSAKSEI